MEIMSIKCGIEHHARIVAQTDGWWVEYTVKEPTCFCCRSEHKTTLLEAREFLLNWQNERLNEIETALKIK